MQIDYKQLKNFPALTPQEQTNYLYQLVLLIILNNYQNGLPLGDPILIQELQNALNQNKQIAPLIQ